MHRSTSSGRGSGRGLRAARAAWAALAALCLGPAACSSSDGGGEPPADGGAGSETSVIPAEDGGPITPPKKCDKPADCPSRVCTSAGECAPSSPTDGVQNDTETDIDCGGAAPRCADQKKCAVAADCASGVCADVGAGLQCQPPSPTDGVKNGTETGVDCGGAAAPKCGDGQGCALRSDCASDVCVAGKCAAAVCNDVAKNGT
jgi:hypothetical protein